MNYNSLYIFLVFLIPGFSFSQNIVTLVNVIVRNYEYSFYLSKNRLVGLFHDNWSATCAVICVSNGVYTSYDTSLVFNTLFSL